MTIDVINGLQMKARALLHRTWPVRALVLVYFAAISVAFTWPLAKQMGDSVVGQLGDNMHFAWMIGWFQKALLQDHVSPFFAPQLNFPEGWHLARSELAVAQSLLGLPFSTLSGPVFAYNLVSIGSFALSGLAAYYWVSHSTSDRLAGVLAGTVFAFAPYRIAHFRAGHLNLLGTFGLPLFFMGFLSLLNGAANWKGIVIGGLGLGLTAISSQYYFYIAFLTAAVIYLIDLASGGWRGLASRTNVRPLIAMAVVAAPLAAIGTLPYLQLAVQDSLPDRPVESLSIGSASVSDFLLPSTDHFLWGSWVGDHFSRDHWTEGTLYLGVASGALAIAAVARATDSRRKLTRRLALLFGVATILALGTHLYWNEQLVRVQLPGLIQSVLHRESTAIPTPGYVLVRLVPFYAKLRTFKRAGVLALLAVAALAGLGAAGLRERIGGRKGTGLLLLLTALVLFDFYPGPFEQVTRVQPRPVDLWLADQTAGGAVAEFPFSLEQEQINVFYTLIHGKPFLGGFFNAFPPPQYLRIQPLMTGFPNRASLAVLEDLGVEYILVEASSYPDSAAVQSTLSALGAVFIGNMNGELVFEIP